MTAGLLSNIMMKSIGRNHAWWADTLDRNLWLIQKVNKFEQFGTTLLFVEKTFQSGMPRDAGRLI